MQGTESTIFSLVSGDAGSPTRLPVVEQAVLLDAFASGLLSPPRRLDLAARCLQHVVIENLDCGVAIAAAGCFDDGWLADLRLRAAPRMANVESSERTHELRTGSPRSPRMVVIAGLAGSGKTEVGQRLSRELGWPFFDKDTLTRRLVEAELEAAGRSPDDRESVEYFTGIRPLEYRALEATALLNLRRNYSCVIAAPYVRELRDAAWYGRMRGLVESAGATLAIVWVNCDADSMLMQLTSRGASRDNWKLAHWTEYLEWVEPARRPSAYDVEIDNSHAPVGALLSQIRRVAKMVSE